jgi:hypothetical protein
VEQILCCSATTAPKRDPPEHIQRRKLATTGQVVQISIDAF